MNIWLGGFYIMIGLGTFLAAVVEGDLDEQGAPSALTSVLRGVFWPIIVASMCVSVISRTYDEGGSK